MHWSELWVGFGSTLVLLVAFIIAMEAFDRIVLRRKALNEIAVSLKEIARSTAAIQESVSAIKGDVASIWRETAP
jgi:hypothetical protein